MSNTPHPMGPPHEIAVDWRPGRPQPTIQERFEEFHAKHPEVYEELVRFARLVKRRGKSRYSIDACFQRVRWYFEIDRDADEAFKLNDHYRSRYARLIEEQESDLRGFFETRKLRRI